METCSQACLACLRADGGLRLRHGGLPVPHSFTAGRGLRAAAPFSEVRAITPT